MPFATKKQYTPKRQLGIKPNGNIPDLVVWVFIILMGTLGGALLGMITILAFLIFK